MRRELFRDQERLVWEAGGNQSAPALVLLPAWPLDSRLWANLAARLEVDYRLLRIEWRGCSPGDPPETGAAAFANWSSSAAAPPLTPAELAADVSAICDCENLDSAVFIGCSLGGYVLYECLRQFPRRIRAAVICDARPEADADGGEARRTADALLLSEAAHGGAESARSAWCARLLPRLLGATSLARRPEVVRQLREWIASRSILAAVRLNQGMALRRDSRDLLPSLRLPVQILAGEEDALWPASQVRQTAAALPGARRGFIPQAGHLPMLENPGPFEELLLAFLRPLTK